MRTLRKTFSNENLVIKILRFINHSFQPKVIVIFESKSLVTMDTHNLFDKLKEHEMKLKILTDDEEDNKKKRKSISLKSTNIEDMKIKDEVC